MVCSKAIAQEGPAELAPQDSSASAMMLRIGKSYLGTAYVANTLDGEEEECLVVRKDAVDCLTFVEYTLAQALGASFTENLQKIRYRDGIIDGYPSRLHYTSDWIDNGVKHGFLTDVTAAHNTPTLRLSLSYMSTHPKLYKKLADSPENVLRMATLASEKRTAGKRIAVDYGRRYHRHHHEAARTGHRPRGDSRL